MVTPYSSQVSCSENKDHDTINRQPCSGKFGIVGTLGSPLTLLSPSFLPLPFFALPSPPLPYLMAIISMLFLRINSP